MYALGGGLTTAPLRVAIHQPHYVPWEGYLAKWRAADLLIVLDTVQFTRGGWQNRARINDRWLTVPVHAPFGTLIRDVTIDEGQAWRHRHRQELPEFGDLYDAPWGHLLPLAVATMTRLCRHPYVMASDLNVTATGPTARLVALCQAVGATEYLSGPHGPRYLEFTQFERAGIGVEIFANR